MLGRLVAVPAAEDVVITKLRWSHQAGRRKDIEDARNVVAVQRTALDWDYLRRWGSTLGVQTLLDDIVRSLPR